jgi:hypothetical protein
MTLRSTSASDLRDLGKTAADLASSSGLGLTEAVVRTIGHTKLSTEQVRRVVEAANHASFQKAAQMTHSVNFDSGPADPSVVLEALKTASLVPVVMYSTADYDLPPMRKTASAHPAVREAVQDIRLLRDKLADAHEECVASAEAAKAELQSSFNELSKQANRALMSGATPDDLVRAWMSINEELGKTASERLGLRLTGVKTAGQVNPDHPVMTTFATMANAVQSYASYETARGQLEIELTKVSSWLREQAVSA